MEYAIIFLVIVVIVLLIINITKKKTTTIKLPDIQNETTTENETEFPTKTPTIFPYTNRFLLTKNEWYFYKSLKPIADKHNLHILAKTRLADIIEVKNIDRKEKQAYFNKIKSKHIDFTLCNPENLKVLLLIELDDNAHNSTKTTQRDIFVDEVLDKCGYKLLRTRGTATLENEILSALPQNKETAPIQ